MMDITWLALGIVSLLAGVAIWKLSSQYRLNWYILSGLALGVALILFSVAWGVGAGWEARVSPNFAIGVAYDYRWIGVGELTDQVDDVSAGTQSVTLSLNWYMD